MNVKVTDIKLSILICHLQTRKNFYKRLLIRLAMQMSPEVEILTETDDGTLSVGEKRNKLLENAIGDYICFIDDDDMISEDYIPLILKAIEHEPDVVGIHLYHIEDGKLVGKTEHSLSHKNWSENHIGFFKRYYRNPNHINPVKRTLALKTKFPLISFGEDKEYSKNLLPLLKKEVFIPEYIYQYRFLTNKIEDCDEA